MELQYPKGMKEKYPRSVAMGRQLRLKSQESKQNKLEMMESEKQI